MTSSNGNLLILCLNSNRKFAIFTLFLAQFLLRFIEGKNGALA